MAAGLRAASLLAVGHRFWGFRNSCWFGRNFPECCDQTLIANRYLPAVFLSKLLNRFDLFLPGMACSRPEFGQVIVEDGKMLFLLQCLGNPVRHLVNTFKHFRSVPARACESKAKSSDSTKKKSVAFPGREIEGRESSGHRYREGAGSGNPTRINSE